MAHFFVYSHLCCFWAEHSRADWLWQRACGPQNWNIDHHRTFLGLFPQTLVSPQPICPQGCCQNSFTYTELQLQPQSLPVLCPVSQPPQPPTVIGRCSSSDLSAVPSSLRPSGVQRHSLMTPHPFLSPTHSSPAARSSCWFLRGFGKRPLLVRALESWLPAPRVWAPEDTALWPAWRPPGPEASWPGSSSPVTRSPSPGSPLGM